MSTEILLVGLNAVTVIAASTVIITAIRMLSVQLTAHREERAALTAALLRKEGEPAAAVEVSVRPPAEVVDPRDENSQLGFNGI